MPSHNDRMARVTDHRQIVGAVAENIAVVQGRAQIIDEKVDASGFGAAFRNQLVKMIVAHRFPLYAVKIVRDRLKKTVKIAVGVAEYHKLVKIHLRVVKIPDGVGRRGAGISRPDIFKRRDQIHAVVKKAGEMSLQSALYVGLPQNINQAETNGIRQFVVKQRLTLEDYLEQLDSVKKMGGIGDMMKMLPGMAGKVKSEDIDEDKLMRAKVIIQSMTVKERRNPDIIKGSRRKRIAQGSGTSIQEVNQLLKQFELTREMMSRMQKGGMKGLRGMKGMKGLF